MKLYSNRSFASQLIIYIFIVLFIGFLCISLALTNSLEQFITHNAYSQSNILATNIMNIFEREIKKIERIPVLTVNIDNSIEQQHIKELPLSILKSYSIPIGCSIHYTSGISDRAAYKVPDGTIKVVTDPAYSHFFRPDTNKIICKNSGHGYWVYSHVNNYKTIAYCRRLYDKNKKTYGILKIDFPILFITNLICDYKLFQSGYFFIMDKEGQFITPPEDLTTNPALLLTNVCDPNCQILLYKIKHGETGYTTISLNHTKHYVYYTPISLMDWRLGIICPYNEILQSSNKLYLLLFICLGLGLLFLFIGITNIVRRMSSPLSQLAHSARRIAEGQFNTQLITPKSGKEICELYDSFRYMQKSLTNYIERLQITTAEKERMNAEMNLAKRIQQRFLPQHPSLPSNIELIAELRQCREVGGDLYEFFQVENRLYFTIGDVSGKGAPAALYMASLYKLFRYVASCNSSVATICNIINHHMCDDINDDMFITMFIGALDINTGILTYTNAGHPYPIIMHENGISHFLDNEADIPIGVMEEHHYSEHTYTLRKGMSILMYTDGVIDAENTSGQFYGKDKMMAALQSIQEKSPANIIQILLEDIHKHIGKQNPSDDLTLLVIRYKGIPKQNYSFTTDSLLG